ncbi:MAG: hypothetical protein JRJ62_00040 [Deltaproteobacteria bacterium]|nr:hypothetical protein [Deltaproteobacteria bacterium]
MPDPTITNVNIGDSILSDAKFRDELLTFAGAGTVLAGSILARDSVSLKLVPFVKGGVANENGIPKTIVTYDIVAAGAGDESIRAGVAGSYRKERLIIIADGDDSNIDSVVIDQLRDYGLIPQNVTELNIQDNQ